MGTVFAHVVDVLPQFLLACLILAILPGPATALFLHRSVRDGRAAGLAAVAGNEIGIFGWALAAGSGLTALLQANRMLYDALHVAGAAVLVWLGVSAWRSAGRMEVITQTAPPAGRTPAAAFRASLVSIAANPKAAVFAFSFFPQFLPSDGPVFATTVTLATIQVIFDGAYCALIVVLAVRVRDWLSRATIRRRLERTLGAILIALGVRLATETR
jgi:threonine/homoserine/homoserine lactone efflux protein